MAAIKHHTSINRIILWTASSLLFGYCLLTILPWQPVAYGYHLDESWASALHIAFRDQIQFGTDFIYTYGPYGFLRVANYYFPETYPYAFGFSIFIAIAAWAGLSRIMEYCLSKRHRSWVFLIPVLWFFPHSYLAVESFQFLLVMLPLILYFYISKRITLTLVLTIINASLSSLTKHTSLLLAIALITLITIDEIGKLKRIPRVATIYCAFLLMLWVFANQSVANIPAYIFNSLEVIRGFSAAMGIPGHLDEVLLYSFGVGIFLIVVGVIEWKNHRWWGFLPTLGLAANFFLIFKGAFTRHDAHALQAIFNATPVMLVFAAILWSSIRNSSWRINQRTKLSLPFLLGFSALCMTIMSSIVLNQHLKYGNGAYMVNAIDSQFRKIPQVVRLLSGQGNFSTIAQEGKAAIRAENVLPPVSGTVDLYPNDLANIFANDLEYQPRPTVQSFSAYTDKLARLNLEHLSQPNAPQNILFDLNPIDRRMASFEDGLSWPEILTRYDIINLKNRYLLLQRNAQPRKYQFEPIQDWIDVTFNQWFDLEDTTEPVWAKMDIHPNILGKLTTTALRLPRLYLEIETADGAIEKYRTVGDIMSEGFLLSPVLSSRWDFLDLASEDWQTKLADKQVIRFRIIAEDSNAWRYPPQYQVSLSQFKLTRQSFASVTGWQDWQTQIMPTPVSEKRLSRLDVNGGAAVGWSAYAPYKMELVVDQAQKRFSFDYGILDREVEKALKDNQGDGVKFEVSALRSNGERTIVFNRHLNPIINLEDRGIHHASIDLSKVNAVKLIMKTAPGKDDLYDFSYWSNLKLK